MKKIARIWLLFVALVALSTSSLADNGWVQWAQQSNTLAEFSASTTANASTGLVTLPSWMTIACATTGRTTQTSASTLVKGLGANAARARNVGSGWGLSVESARTQAAKTSQVDGTWGLFTGATYALTTGPDGANTAALLGDPGAGSVAEVFKSAVFTIVNASVYTFSIWSGPATRSVGADFGLYSINQNTPVSISSPTGNAVSWGRLSTTFTADAGPTGLDMLPCYPNVECTGTVAIGEAQLELGRYPTSVMPNVSGASVARAADVLTVLPGAVAPIGYFDVDFTFAPNYANAEQAADDVLLYFDANDQIFLQQSTAKVVERIGGAGHDVLSSAMTWSREDAIRVVALHTTAGLSLSVYKNGSQQGTTQTGSAQSAISLPASVGILGNGTTTAESADLRSFAAYRR